jgi:hypothetical protein
VIALPPLLAGGVTVTVAEPGVVDVAESVGDPGNVIGVTRADAADGSEV